MWQKTTHWIRDARWLAAILIVTCFILLFLSSVFGIVINVLVMGVILGVTAAYISYHYPRYNMVILLANAFLLPFFMRAFHLYGIPVGISNELLTILIVFTLLLSGRFSGWKSLPGILVMGWFFFQCMELLNPNAASRIAGFFAIRGIIVAALAFFIMYSSIESKRDFYTFFKGWFVLGALAGLYGLYQEFMGLPSFDYEWASYDETIYNLLFTWGRMRKFSFFFSPSEFGMAMAYTGVAGIIIFFFEDLKRRTRMIALGIGVICLWAMIYTGSRTASVMLPVGFMIFAVISLKRNVLIAVACFFVGGVILVLRPVASGSLFVMLTAFSGSDDPSMNVRLMNQKIIQTYIQQNPIGFGLGSTGDLGLKYSPNTFVGSFPPDSEFVKIAVETGWVGLFIWCTILALIFTYGINLYFRIKDREWRNILLVPLCIFFMMIVAQYPQEFFRAPVLALLYSSMVGLIAKIAVLTDHPEETREEAFDNEGIPE